MTSRNNLPIYGVLILLFLLSLLVSISTADEKEKAMTENESLFVFAGAGLKIPVQEASDQFSKKTRIIVDVNYAGAGSLLSQMELTRTGDVFISGGEPDYMAAQNKDLVGEPVYLAYHVPVLAIQKENPKTITSVTDLTNPGMKVALGDEKSTAIGKASKSIFETLGISDAVEKNVILRTTTINELVLALESGTIDATILTLDQIKPEIMDIIPLPDQVNSILRIPAGVTTFSTNPEVSAEFIAYISSNEGKAIFQKHGFPTYPNPSYEQKSG